MELRVSGFIFAEVLELFFFRCSCKKIGKRPSGAYKRTLLEEVACEHAVLVRAYALSFLTAFGVEGGGVGVFDDLQFVLLIVVEETVEGIGRKKKGLGN